MAGGAAKTGGDRPPRGVGSWRTRRLFMFAVTAFSMGTIAYILYRDMDSRVADTAVTMAFFTLISTVGSYVFGAAWQDVNTIRQRGGGYGGGYGGGGWGGGDYDGGDGWDDDYPRRRSRRDQRETTPPAPGGKTAVEQVEELP